ncbi:Glutathionyl-hydroquinone reductase YqjG [Camellia lanceoleosa]|uniref:Glutathionyl-hydroquinone reductase YqjG n=1 Tax=Camellia lanceoleosa TaxID=1840588 RepID=A0ACC0FSX8_9ERIC|nr:Glutathionyl-hydroquinone reductase YqjG [Camellia lanceoleosa]
MSVCSTPTPHLHRPFHLVRRVAPHDVPTRPLRPDRPLHPTHLPISLHPIFSPKSRHSPSLRGLAVPLSPPDFDRSDPQGPQRCRACLSCLTGTGRDVERKEVVCNESYNIIELFNSGSNLLAKNPDLDLSSPSLKKKIEDWNQIIYPNVNNGVYWCGFSQSQQAYDSVVNELFSTLDMVDDHLSSFRYFCGDVLTLADLCLFNGIPKVAATCNFGAIMDGYYNILFPLNPSSIRPVMPSGYEHEFLS